MEFSRRASDVSESWGDWEWENVRTERDAVKIAPGRFPDYDALEPEIESETWIDLAIDRCGQVFLLTDEGQIHQYIPDSRTLVRVDCDETEHSNPRAIAVDADSIYVASGDPGRVRAYSRHVGAIRWTRTNGIVDPVTFVRVDGHVHILDRGEHPGTGEVSRIDPDGELVSIVTDLFEPIDVDADEDGSLYVLEPHVWNAEDAPDRYTVRTIPAQVLAYPPVPAVDTVWIPPEAFRAGASGAPVSPAALAAGDGGELLVGTASDGLGENALFSFRPARGAFEFQASVLDGSRALAVDRTADPTRLYVIDENGALFRTHAEPTVRRNRSTGEFDGRVSVRFDSGIPQMHWHRVRVARSLPAGETGVNLRYHATDADCPEGLSLDPDEIPTDLTKVDGIGPRKSWRLRRAGIVDLEDLAANDAETVAAIVSVEEIAVPGSDVAGWQEEADSLLAAGEQDLEAVTGIGPVFAERLQAGGVDTLQDLVDRDLEDVSSLLGTRLRTVSTERTAGWITDAAAIVPDPPNPEQLDWQAVPPDPEEVFLHDAVGRYLWVELELLGSRYTSPSVDAFEASYPRQSYLDELPAVYRADTETSAFLEPFLALFESVLTEVEAGIEDLLAYMDADGIPARPGYLKWLGGWLAAEMDDMWPEGAKRAFIAEAPELYRKRGTRRGLQATIDLYLEHVDIDLDPWEAENELRLARVVEHADLDCATGDARTPYERLISCPQGFLVLLHPALEEEHHRAIGRIVGHQRPAHTSGRAVALRPLTVLTGHDCGERGFHTYLGINTVLPSQAFQLDGTTLGQETVLIEHEPHGALGVRAQLDEDVRLS